MGLLDVATQTAINDDGRECSMKNPLLHTGQSRTFPVACVKVRLICKKSIKLRGGMTKIKLNLTKADYSKLDLAAYSYN